MPRNERSSSRGRLEKVSPLGSSNPAACFRSVRVLSHATRDYEKPPPSLYLLLQYPPPYTGEAACRPAVARWCCGSLTLSRFAAAGLG